MSIEVVWDNPGQTVIRYAVDGEWRWADLTLAGEQAHQLLDSVHHPVSFLIDLTASTAVPSLSFSRGKQHNVHRHANADKIVFVGARLYVQTLFEVFNKVNPKAGTRVVFAASLDQASAILQSETSQKG